MKLSCLALTGLFIITHPFLFHTNDNTAVAGVMVVLNSPTAAKIKRTDRILGAVSVSGDVGPYVYEWYYVSEGDTTYNPVTTASSWIVNPGYLPLFVPGTTVRLVIKVTSTVTLAVGSTFKEFVINTPPSGGALNVSPSTGQPFTTTFTISANGWYDDGTMLTYQFGYFRSDGGKNILNTRSANSTLFSSLPQGPLTGNELELYVDVYDDMNDTTEVRCRVTVTAELPVELETFSAAVCDGTPRLRWRTATEKHNLGFDVERRRMERGGSFQVDGSWNVVGFVKGSGTSNVPMEYEYLDTRLPAGIYAYRLRQIDANGQSVYSASAEIRVDPPSLFGLSQNFPNPFNPTTVIRYHLPTSAHVTIRVYDALGQEIAAPVDGFKAAGSYDVVFDGSALASGAYLCRLSSDGRLSVLRIVLAK